MNWFIPKYCINCDYKNVKCKYCQTETIFNLNIREKKFRNKLMNLDGSPHRCWESKVK